MSFLYNNEVEISGPLNQFSELQTIQRTPIIEILPLNGVSALRDANTVTGSASIGTANGVIELSTGATANSVATLDTAEKGRYMAGLGGEAGVGIRFTSNNNLSGNAEIIWGYGDDEDGAFFGKDANNLFVEILRSEIIQEKKYSNEWNIDPMDGSGPSGATLDLIDGNIYQIEYTWYGYGDVLFNIIDTNPATQRQKKIPVHVYRPAASTSIQYPNLPIRVQVSNGDQNENYSVEVGGRQYSVIGPYSPSYRVVSEYQFNQPTDDVLRPFITFKSKDDKASRSVSKKVQGFSVLPATEDVYIEVRIGGNVSNTQSFRVPINYPDNEITSQVDTTADTISGGIPIWGDIAPAAGAGQGNQSDPSGSGGKSGLALDIPDEKTCSICIRTTTGGTGTATVIFRWQEEV